MGGTYFNDTLEHFFHQVTRPFVALDEIETTVREVGREPRTLGAVVHKGHILRAYVCLCLFVCVCVCVCVCSSIVCG